MELPEPHDLAERVNDTWTHIFTRLMASGLGREENEDQLLAYHWLMAHDPTEKNWEGAKSLKEEFHLRDFKGNHEGLLEALLKYVETLKDATTAYCDVMHPRHPDAFSDLLGDEALREQVIEAAEKLPRLGVVAPFLPLLVALRLKLPGKGEVYLRAVEPVRTVRFRVYRLLQRRSNTGRSRLFLLGHWLYTDQNSTKDTLLGVIELIREYSPDPQVDEEYAPLEDSDWYTWTGLKYFLYEYEAFLAESRNSESQDQLEALSKLEHSIEHILPQTPTHKYWLGRWTEDQRKMYTHDLGNLCLTLDNSSYGNKPFPAKRGEAGSDNRCYSNGDLMMEPRNLAAYEDWDEDTLLKQPEDVIDWAKERWGLPLPKKAKP